MIKTVRIAIATALLLAAGNAAALGLGQIEVKSRINQPLLAEIPIVSTVPGELEALQARLASPETFRRIGLAPPTGIAADLQFSLGNDARGRPVIRVTTTAPVNQSVLNFLIEVDWGQGRLVREYSALVDAPRTASAAVQPSITAPVVAAPNVVQRPLPPPAVVPAAPVPAALPPAAVPPPAAAAAEPIPQSTAVAPAPAASAVAAAAVAAPLPSPAQYGPIKRGETLSKIAGQLPLPAGYTLDQAMLALLRANPEAFLGDDVNQLKQGAVLRVPGSAELGSVSADEAALVVREQMRERQQARRAVAQPVASTVDASRPASPAPTVAPPPAAPAPATAVRRQQIQARLAIVPPSAPGKATGTRSGTSAGGEGTMLQQQLQQRDEDLAARRAEVGELKERVAELEKLQQQQQQLLALKDSELAAAQQRLAAARTAVPAAAASNASTAAAPAPAAAQGEASPSASAGTMPWLWGGFGLVGVALLAWLIARRSKRAPVSPRRVFDSEALAASMVPAAPDPEHDTRPSATGVMAEAPPVRSAEPHAPTTPAPARFEAPAWHSGHLRKTAQELPVAPAAMPSFVDVDEPAAAPPPASAAQRMNLARAFLDIGDDTSARQLLRELLDDADPAARTDAARMLRELG